MGGSAGALDVGAIGRGLLGGLFGVGVLTALATLILSLSGSPAQYLGVATAAVAWLSVAAAGYGAARAAGRGALLHGSLAGVVLVAFLLVLGTLLLDQQLPLTNLLPRLALALLVGALGGVVGIGL